MWYKYGEAAIGPVCPWGLIVTSVLLNHTRGIRVRRMLILPRTVRLSHTNVRILGGSGASWGPGQGRQPPVSARGTAGLTPSAGVSRGPAG